MVEPAHRRRLSHCGLLRIGRSSLYYAPVPETDEKLALLKVIDEAFILRPWNGSRPMAQRLQRESRTAGRRRARHPHARGILYLVEIMDWTTRKSSPRFADGMISLADLHVA